MEKSAKSSYSSNSLYDIADQKEASYRLTSLPTLTCDASTLEVLKLINIPSSVPGDAPPAGRGARVVGRRPRDDAAGQLPLPLPDGLAAAFRPI